MYNNIRFKLVVAFGLLAVLLLFLGVNYVPRIAAGSSAKEKAPVAVNYAGSDWIERHPPAVVSSMSLAGSDWIERHPSNFYVNSDWIERHPSTYYDNSDWFERHSGERIP